jgi:hypothetical protein
MYLQAGCGMDDYPRGPPHAGELHLDLISWMVFFTGTMKDIAEFVRETDNVVSFGEIEQAILNNIDSTILPHPFGNTYHSDKQLVLPHFFAVCRDFFFELVVYMCSTRVYNNFGSGPLCPTTSLAEVANYR